MKSVSSEINERHAEAAFSLQAPVFDELYSEDSIVSYKRKRVREHLLRYLKPGSSILELNSGTGEDAIYFAGLGYTVHATDLSAGMQQELERKVKSSGLADRISSELCSFTQLSSLKKAGAYDCIFSNFGGLNCTDELDTVLRSFPCLLKPNGIVTMVIISKFCLWEALLIFKGKFKTATRRWFSSKGVPAHIEGAFFKCSYYSPSYILDHAGSDFELLAIEGLCTFVPPSYMSGFAEKHPRLYRLLESSEKYFKGWYPWQYWGDYFIISLRKKAD